MIKDGYIDSHKGIPFTGRGTCPYDELAKIGLDVFDYIWIKGNFTVKDAVVCNEKYS